MKGGELVDWKSGKKQALYLSNREPECGLSSTLSIISYGGFRNGNHE